jgi:GMP synthase (glutamine-hydrolysing)
MNATKPFLILQLRPEDDTSDSEFEAILKYGELQAQHAHRLRIEKTGIPELALEDYAAVIVGGSPFDISTPPEQKSAIQVKIEADFRRLFDEIVSQDIPFLGACSGCGLLGSYLDTPTTGRLPATNRRTLRAQGSLRHGATGRNFAVDRRCLPGADVPRRRKRLRHPVPSRG